MPILSKASNVEPNVFFRDGVPYWDIRRNSPLPLNLCIIICALPDSQLTDAAKRVSAAEPLEKPACR